MTSCLEVEDIGNWNIQFLQGYVISRIFFYFTVKYAQHFIKSLDAILFVHYQFLFE